MFGLTKPSVCFIKNFLCIALFFIDINCEYEYLIHAQKLPNRFECREDLCKNLFCEKLRNCSDGVIMPKASYCHCCDICVKYLDFGDDCEEILEGSLRDIAKSQCKLGLKCENKKCVYDSKGNINNCLFQKHIRESKRKEEEYYEDLWIPLCDDEGKFKPNQEKNRKSMCFDDYGNKLFGNEDDGSFMSCSCSRHMNTVFHQSPQQYNAFEQEHCISAGSFDSIQCIKNLCYCADQDSGDVKGRLVRKDHLDKLPCFNISISKNQYLKLCEQELLRTRHLAYELYLKGVNLLGVDRVTCDSDGTFSPTQCTKERCVCTDKNGVGIGSYAIGSDALEELETAVICNCARDGIYTESAFRCEGHGNYAYLQCFNSDHCNCVDLDGAIISKPFKKSSKALTFCKELNQKLLISNIDEFKTTVIENEMTDYEYEYL